MIVHSIREVATHFGVTNRTARYWMDAKGMPVRGPSTYDLEEIGKWLDENRRRNPKKGMGDRQVMRFARRMGVSPAYLVRVLDQVRAHKQELDLYAAHKGDKYLIDEIRSAEIKDYCKDILAGRVKDEELTKKDAAQILDKIGLQEKREYDTGRIESGDSTENIAVVMKGVLELREQEKERRRRLAEAPDGPQAEGLE